MIEATRFHFVILNGIGSAFNCLRWTKVARAVLCAPIMRPTEEIAPKSVSAFLSWLPATTPDRSLAPYPTRNVPASSAHWEFSGSRPQSLSGLSLHLLAND